MTDISAAPLVGFIILRHINRPEIDLYWRDCYQSIRTFYPDNPIMIIDDNSNQSLIKPMELHNTIVIQSEYPGRGELLPYIYYLKHRFCDTAVILHDSVFIQKQIDFKVDNYKLLWEFEHDWDNTGMEAQIINLFKDKGLVHYYFDKSQWKGCFGGMSIITHDFLTMINSKHDLSILLGVITTRHLRMCFERIIACLLQYYAPKTSLCGNIHTYIPWGVTYKHRHAYSHLPLLKIWTGR